MYDLSPNFCYLAKNCVGEIIGPGEVRYMGELIEINLPTFKEICGTTGFEERVKAFIPNQLLILKCGCEIKRDLENCLTYTEYCNNLK